MDNKYVIGPDGELYHWGTKGMRWGIRRYQNKDGSLTPAGKKRYKSTEEELKAREKVIKNMERVRAMQAKQAAKKAELDAREAALNDGPKKKTLKETLQERKEAKAAKKAAKAGHPDTSKPKSIKDMTDDELRAYTSRMQLEKSFLDAQRNLDAVTPKQVNKSKEFIGNLMKDVVAPTASKVGKEWLEKVAMDKLGLNKKEVDALKKLEEDAKKAKAEYEIADYKNKRNKVENGGDADEKPLSVEDQSKKFNLDKNKRDYESGKEGMERHRAQLEAVYGKNSDEVVREMKKYADEIGFDYGKPKQKDTDTGSSKPESNTADTSSNKPKQNDNDSSTYGTKAYEAKVDRMLSDADDKAWDAWESEYSRADVDWERYWD